MLIIFLWMLVFALTHSVTADKQVKNWFQKQWGQRFYEGFYRLFYNTLSTILLLPVALILIQPNNLLWQVGGPLGLLFIVIQLSGLVGLALSFLQIDAGRFLGIRQLIAYLRDDPLPLPDESLQTGGIYAWSRHPLYFFSLLFIWFMPIMTDVLFMFNVAATLYFLIGSQLEERRMLQTYGDGYKNYQQHVSWMLPLPPAANVND